MSSALERLRALQGKKGGAADVVSSVSAAKFSESSTGKDVLVTEQAKESKDSDIRTNNLESTEKVGTSDKSGGGTTGATIPSPSTSSPDPVQSRCSGNPDNPLMMQLAELEDALLKKLPEFRTILRDIHTKLRQDPEVVTILTEDEVSLIVSGLVTHANVDIIAPRTVKAAKKAAKTPISAGDL